MLLQTTADMQALASPTFLERGCVNVISLEAIKDEAGPRWPRVCGNVYDRIETLLKQRLGPADFFARISDSSYLVTMPTTEPEDVNAVCLRIAYDLCSNLLGDCDISKLQVSKASQAEDHKMALKPLSVERVSVLAEKAGIGDFERRKGDKKNGAVYSRDAGTVINPDHVEGGPHALTISHQYLALWSSANKAVTTYLCEPSHMTSLDIPKRPITMAQLGLKERSLVELSSLRDGIDKLSHHIETGDRFILGLQVSYDVFATPSGRMDYLNECRNLSQEYRPYIDFFLTNVPAGVPQSRLHDLIITLRPFARSVCATVAVGNRNFSGYQNIGLRAIGYNAREFPLDYTFTQDDANTLFQGARNTKLGTFMLGIGTVDMLKTAQQCGIQSLSGPAIEPARPEPKGMSRLSWESILASHEVLSV